MASSGIVENPNLLSTGANLQVISAASGAGVNGAGMLIVTGGIIRVDSGWTVGGLFSTGTSRGWNYDITISYNLSIITMSINKIYYDCNIFMKLLSNDNPVKVVLA